MGSFWRPVPLNLQAGLILLDIDARHRPADARTSLTTRVTGSQFEVTVRNASSSTSASEDSHVFDRFYQGKSGRNHSPSRYDVGPRVAQSIVLSHEHTHAAQSENANGTDLTLPQQPEDSGEPEQSQADGDHTAAEAS